MRKLYFLIAIVFLGLEASAQWHQQNSGTNSNLNDIFFTDYNNGWAVGDEGIIIYTDDGGENWIQQPSVTDFHLESICFIDTLNGWVAGWNSDLKSGIILHTYNGGAIWEEMFIDTLFYLNDIFFTDSSNGWAAGSRYFFMGAWGTILHTDDGGSTWKRLEQPSIYIMPLRSIYFTDPDTGWVVGGFYAGSSGYPYCNILKTTDGGFTWVEQISTSGTYSPLNDVDFTDTKNGWTVGTSCALHIGPKPNLLRTVDGGMHWDTLVYTGIYGLDNTLSSVCFIDKNMGWAVGKVGWFGNLDYTLILWTSDGGINWTEQSSGINKMLNSVCFINDEEGWIAADSGIILHTDNGGIVGVNNHVKAEEGIDLMVYPNPCSETALLKFKIEDKRSTISDLYSISGVLIKRLMNRELQAGTHKVEVDVSDLPDGVYLIRIQAGDYVFSRKLMKIND